MVPKRGIPKVMLRPKVSPLVPIDTLDAASTRVLLKFGLPVDGSAYFMLNKTLKVYTTAPDVVSPLDQLY